MTDIKEYFDKYSIIWSNRNEYFYFENISLSSAQKRVVDYEKRQLLINGAAGTGKSLTLIYKLFNSMGKESNKKRFLYITFNETLIKDVYKRLDENKNFKELIQRHDVDITTYHKMVSKIGKRLNNQIADDKSVTKNEVECGKTGTLRKLGGPLDSYINSEEYINKSGSEKFFKTHSAEFFRDEFLWMKANGIMTREIYYDVERVGRTQSIRLTKEQRKSVFDVFELYLEREKIQKNPQFDLEDHALFLLKSINQGLITDELKYDYIYVDEVQDFQAMQLKSLGLLYKKAITIAGDPRQSVYKRTPLSYEKLGFDFKSAGNMRILNNNYRSTYEIACLSSDLSFVDQNYKKLNPKNFLSRGDKPKIVRKATNDNVIKYLIKKIKKVKKDDEKATICVVIRDHNAFNKNAKAKNAYISKLKVVSELRKNFKKVRTEDQYNMKNINSETVFVFDPYDIKGLEFDYIYIYNFSDNVYPIASEYDKLERMIAASQGADINKSNDVFDFIESEKKILYVVMTRAKKGLELLLSEKSRISRFAEDFNKKHFDVDGIAKYEVVGQIK